MTVYQGNTWESTMQCKWEITRPCPTWRRPACMLLLALIHLREQTHISGDAPRCSVWPLTWMLR